MSDKLIKESDLAGLAKKIRTEAGKSRAQAAKELKVAPPSLFHAEESPRKSLTRLRCRIIETYSSNKVTGPYYRIEQPKK